MSKPKRIQLRRTKLAARERKGEVMNNQSEKFVYVGRLRCGCGCLITVDAPEHAKENAKSLAEVVRDGGSIERMALADARKNFLSTFGDKCPECANLEARP